MGNVNYLIPDNLIPPLRKIMRETGAMGKKRDKPKGNGNMKTCSSCGGAGRVVKNEKDGVTIYESCGGCGGSGVVSR